eukprot:CAMPEP_0176440232 /NCGR_PEP_ID=MMETSP0127-20121128/20440_1 /TAXON_ID=938130 /ORGANISM="Platyophrya macrostoma, Strain WH" /LENGTH=339 /DNA_ID=CAMNT_0017824701 /DNA_START=240 /DNA_END=1259 /DNA_ORIENTATION=-
MFQMDIEFDLLSESSGFQKVADLNQNFEFDFYNAQMIQYDNLKPQMPLYDLEFASDFKQEELMAKIELSDSTDALGEESTPDYVSNLLSAKNYSKDGLKFSRRIAKMMTKHLSSVADGFVSVYLGASASVINSILGSYGIEGISKDEVVKAQQEVLATIWGEFKNILSYNKNKKICIVKAEYWNIVFCKQTFTGLAKESCKALKGELAKLFAGFEGILNAFCEVIFAIHQLMTFTAIIKDGSAKGGQSMRELETIDNMLLMIISPKLFEFYNHRSGKFASECCGKCKICRSRSIPLDFTAVLQDARNKLKMIINEVVQIPSNAALMREDQIMSLLCLLL